MDANTRTKKAFCLVVTLLFIILFIRFSGGSSAAIWTGTRMDCVLNEEGLADCHSSPPLPEAECKKQALKGCPYCYDNNHSIIYKSPLWHKVYLHRGESMVCAPGAGARAALAPCLTEVSLLYDKEIASFLEEGYFKTTNHTILSYPTARRVPVNFSIPLDAPIGKNYYLEIMFDYRPCGAGGWATDEFNIEVLPDEKKFPKDPTFDVGNDGIKEWSYFGNFSTTETIKDFSSELNHYLSNCKADEEGNCLIPLKISSASRGTIQISNINISYKI